MAVDIYNIQYIFLLYISPPSVSLVVFIFFIPLFLPLARRRRRRNIRVHALAWPPSVLTLAGYDRSFSKLSRQERERERLRERALKLGLLLQQRRKGLCGAVCEQKYLVYIYTIVKYLTHYSPAVI